MPILCVLYCMYSLAYYLDAAFSQLKECTRFIFLMINQRPSREIRSVTDLFRLISAVNGLSPRVMC